MVQNETNLVVADNSGARSVRVFRLYGGGNRKSSGIGDIVLCAVKDAIPNGKVKKGDVVKAIIVRTKHAINRVAQQFASMITLALLSMMTDHQLAHVSSDQLLVNSVTKVKDL